VWALSARNQWLILESQFSQIKRLLLLRSSRWIALNMALTTRSKQPHGQASFAILNFSEWGYVVAMKATKPLAAVSRALNTH
jgi:hypothetical protein